MISLTKGLPQRKRRRIEHEYKIRIDRAFAREQIKKGGGDILVKHDSNCGYLKRLLCDCDPEIEVLFGDGTLGSIDVDGTFAIACRH